MTICSVYNNEIKNVVNYAFYILLQHELGIFIYIQAITKILFKKYLFLLLCHILEI